MFLFVCTFQCTFFEVEPVGFLRICQLSNPKLIDTFILADGVVFLSRLSSATPRLATLLTAALCLFLLLCLS